MNQIEEIFNIFLSQIDDEFLALLDEDVFKNQLYVYLCNSIVEFKTCKKDLTIENHIDTSIDIETEVELPCSDCEIKVFNVKEDELRLLEKDKDYTIEEREETKPILRIIGDVEGSCLAKLYKLGDIVSELSWEEKYILGLGMVINWVRIKKNTEENMRNIITDSDYKRLSGANMLDKLIKLYDRTEREHRLRVVQYSYSSFKGLN